MFAEQSQEAHGPEDLPDSNPYDVLEIKTELQSNSALPSRKRSILATALVIVTGSTAAFFAFCVTFYVTCNGIVSSGNYRNLGGFGLFFVSFVPGFFAAAAVILVILKIHRNTNR